MGVKSLRLIIELYDEHQQKMWEELKGDKPDKETFLQILGLAYYHKGEMESKD